MPIGRFTASAQAALERAQQWLGKDIRVK